MEIELEEPFKSIYRKGHVRLRDDGRQILYLYNSPQDRTTTSYARYLMCVKEGRILPGDIEVDHRDGQKSNDDIDNLQSLTFSEHREKTIQYDMKREVEIDLTCPNCQRNFKRTERYLRDKRSQGQAQFHCGRSCSTKVRHPFTVSESLKEQIKILRAGKQSSYSISKSLGISRNTVMKYW